MELETAIARRASLRCGSSGSQSKAFDEICNFRGSWVEVGRRGKDLKMVDIGERGRTERGAPGDEGVEGKE